MPDYSESGFKEWGGRGEENEKAKSSYQKLSIKGRRILSRNLAKSGIQRFKAQLLKPSPIHTLFKPTHFSLHRSLCFLWWNSNLLQLPLAHHYTHKHSRAGFLHPWRLGHCHHNSSKTALSMVTLKNRYFSSMFLVLLFKFSAWTSLPPLTH